MWCSSHTSQCWAGCAGPVHMCTPPPALLHCSASRASAPLSFQGQGHTTLSAKGNASQQGNAWASSWKNKNKHCWHPVLMHPHKCMDFFSYTTLVDFPELCSLYCSCPRLVCIFVFAHAIVWAGLCRVPPLLGAFELHTEDGGVFSHFVRAVGMVWLVATASAQHPSARERV